MVTDVTRQPVRAAASGELVLLRDEGETPMDSGYRVGTTRDRCAPDSA